MRIGRCHVLTDGKQSRRRPMSAQRLRCKILGAVLNRFGKRQMRIASEISRRQNHMLYLHSVVANESPPKIVERQTELSTTVGRFKLIRLRAKAKIRSLEFDRFFVRVIRRAYLASCQTTCQIDPVINPQRGMADSQLSTSRCR